MNINKGKVYLLSAFSLNMLPDDVKMQSLKVINTDYNTLRLLCPLAINAIGHIETDRIVRRMLKEEDVNVLEKGKRSTVKLQENDIAIVAQYYGPRLPEGCLELPRDSEIKFKIVLLEAA